MFAVSRLFANHLVVWWCFWLESGNTSEARAMAFMVIGRRIRKNSMEAIDEADCDQRFVISDVCGDSIPGTQESRRAPQYPALELECANC